ncbi:MAG TPA: Spy/CpxP family protein refolding chaperone [Syntrophorhabdales bacterium]|nr:Spy/CpxP family protein refolding chaperone [Syntrophorhabdales bacterium]
MVRSFLMSCALLVSLAVPLLAQESYREFERDLNLSDAQRAQVEGIKRKYMGEWRMLRMESARKRFELRQILRFQPDQWERVERAQRELDQIEAEKLRLFRQYRDEVSAVFNEEQRGRFNRFLGRENRRPVYPPRYAPPPNAPPSYPPSPYPARPYAAPPETNPRPYRFYER